MRTQDIVPVRLEDHRPYPFAIRHVHLAFALDPKRTLVRATLLVDRRDVEGAAGAPLVLDGETLELLEIAIDGRPVEPARMERTEARLTIAEMPDQFRLETLVAIDPSANTALSGLYMSGGRFCTQCEAEGFRRITFWPDRPDVMSRFDVRVEAARETFPTLLSNGNLVAMGDLPDGRHWAQWSDPHLKPSYLFALVAGGFDRIEDRFVTMSGRDVALTIFVDPGDADRAHYAMDALKRSMAWDERAFGREYDLDVFNIVAVSDFNFGAMENKGLNIFNSALLLAAPETATDADYEAIEAVVAHEYFHNWSGNRVTCRDWFQLSLKEGFTVFRDQEFSADQRSRAVKRIKDVKALRARQFPEDAGPLAHPVRPASYVKIDNFYTATVYEKGAEVIRVLKALIGDKAFAAGCTLYFEENDGHAATIEDWLDAMRRASGQALDGFERWYSQAGTPVLRATSRHDPAARTYELTLSQSTPDTPGQSGKSWVPLPVRLAFLAPDGAPMALMLEGASTPVDTMLVALNGPSVTLRFEGVEARPTPSLLRGFSAPVKLETDLTGEDLARLAACDGDAFSRWEATQTIARQTLLGTAQAVSHGGAAPSLEALGGALQGALAQAEADPAFAALMLRLPDVAELMQILPDCDPTALQAARIAVRGELADRLKGPLLDAFARHDFDAPFDPGAAAAGKRALAAACLDLLTALGGPEAEARAKAAFHAARNMTDKMAALDALSQLGGEAFAGALGAFRQAHGGDALVMDKWFAIQAAAISGDPLATFAKLRADPDFTLFNPNRVRSLGAAFAVRNPEAFHRADGSGYRALAGLVGEVDGHNPALSARLCTGFESAGRVEAGRRAQAAAAIGALLDREALSANAREILTKVGDALSQATTKG
jgi:aminopeptidase N